MSSRTLPEGSPLLTAAANTYQGDPCRARVILRRCGVRAGVITAWEKGSCSVFNQHVDQQCAAFK